MSGALRPVVSVIVPVFNEADTVGQVLDELLALEYELVDFEIIVVESNSTDGSRTIVEQYADDPRVALILQDAPRGKGNAVRAGLDEVTGDIIVIQDADLEYRIAEYPLLLGPILAGETEFVLGCRHVPGRPMRDIPEQRMKGLVLNAAHWAFTALFDITYGVKIRDPFTMFKVFRAECIQGLSFVSDRFDFDWELMAKLIRRGYRPVEVPITYKARGFHEGKKVRLLGDPPTWIRACWRFRVERIPPPRAACSPINLTESAAPDEEVDLRATQVP